MPGGRSQQHAAAKIGAIPVNVKPAYRTHEFSHAGNQSSMRLMVAATTFNTSDYRGMVEETAPLNAALERVIYLDTDHWDALVTKGEALDADVLNVRKRTLEPGDPINIKSTSGTTGHPKGATLSHRNILNNGYLVTELLRFTEQDRLCIPVPIDHCFGMAMANLRLHQPRRDDGDPGLASILAPPSTRCRMSGARRCTAVPADVHREAAHRSSPNTNCRPCGTGGPWPARSARSR